MTCGSWSDIPRIVSSVAKLASNDRRKPSSFSLQHAAFSLQHAAVANAIIIATATRRNFILRAVQTLIQQEHIDQSVTGLPNRVTRAFQTVCMATAVWDIHTAEATIDIQQRALCQAMKGFFG
jgi:hypothetical protein